MQSVQAKTNSAVVYQFALAAFALAAFAWISAWDTYSLQVIPLQAKYTLGFAKADDLKGLSQICFERKRYECSSASLKLLIDRHQSKEPAHFEHIVESYLNLSQPKSALYYIEAFEKVQKPTAEWLEKKAQLQLQIGEEQKALVNYQKATSLATGPKRFSLAREQIALLMKLNLFAQAQSKILEIRKSTALANLFMEKELRMIQRNVASLKLPGRFPAAYRR